MSKNLTVDISSINVKHVNQSISLQFHSFVKYSNYVQYLEITLFTLIR